jgi:hypothetical protein
MTDARPKTSPSAVDAQMQTLGRNLLAGLYMLVRSAKLYDPENAVFQKPLTALSDAFNAGVGRFGKLELAMVQGSFYVNGQLIRVEQTSLENLRLLAAELQAHQLSGLSLASPINVDELKRFLHIFAKNQTEVPGPEGLEGHKLAAMRLTRWAPLRERIAGEDDSASGGPGGTGNVGIEGDGAVSAEDLERRKSMTLYARLVLFVSTQVQALREGREVPPVLRLAGLVQDLVDRVERGQRPQLGRSRTGSGPLAIPCHLVNTSILAAGFGRRLGLPKMKLRDLSLSALVAGATSLSKLTPEQALAIEPERLQPDDFNAVFAARREAAVRALVEPGVPRAQRLVALMAVQAEQPFFKTARDAHGQLAWVPDGDPLELARIAGPCACFSRLTSPGPDRAAMSADEALRQMTSTLSFRFEQGILKAFVEWWSTGAV